MDAGTEQIGVGGALFLAALAMLLKYKPWASTTKTETAGQKSPEWWEMRFEQLVETGVRKAMANRNEEIRRIIREEVGKLRD